MGIEGLGGLSGVVWLAVVGWAAFAGGAFEASEDLVFGGAFDVCTKFNYLVAKSSGGLVIHVFGGLRHVVFEGGNDAQDLGL